MPILILVRKSIVQKKWNVQSALYRRLLSVHSLQRLHAVRKTKQLISSVLIMS